MATDGTGDILVDAHPDSFADGGGGGWSNDGTRLIVNRWYAGADGDIIRSAIVPADGSNVGIDIECASFASPDACNADWIWSPTTRSSSAPRRTQAAGRYRSSWPTH